MEKTSFKKLEDFQGVGWITGKMWENVTIMTNDGALHLLKKKVWVEIREYPLFVSEVAQGGIFLRIPSRTGKANC